MTARLLAVCVSCLMKTSIIEYFAVYTLAFRKVAGCVDVITS